MPHSTQGIHPFGKVPLNVLMRFHRRTDGWQKIEEGLGDSLGDGILDGGLIMPLGTSSARPELKFFGRIKMKVLP